MTDIDDIRSCTRRHGKPLFTLLLAAISLVSATGCVSTQLTPIPLQGAAYQPLDDEIDLWETSRDEESLLLSEVEIYEDPALEDYLNDLVARLESPGMAANGDVRFHVTILDDPDFNAFAYPHGSIYVTSGLLAEVETEDQIAAVLAHEMTHVENRHMARHERARWNRMVPIAALTFGASLALAIEEDDAWDDGDYEEAEFLGELSEVVFFVGLELAEQVSARGYGRRLEREADEGMLQKLRANHYDVSSALSFYDRLSGVGDHGQALAHGLGPDVADRLRTLMKTSASPADSAIAASQPLLAPAELTRLLPAK